MRLLHGALVFGSSMVLQSCGDNYQIPDACWPLSGVPGGSVELGTGEVSFEPMPPMLPIITSPRQSDPYLQVSARIQGLPPGDPSNPFAPGNPNTKVSAAIDQLGLVLDFPCPSRLAYVPSVVPNAFDLQYSLRIGFGTFPIAQAWGQQARISVEVYGSNGLYAQDEKTVTLTTPDAGVPIDAP